MKNPTCSFSPRRLLFSLAILLIGSCPQHLFYAEDTPPSATYLWRDVYGAALPFQDIPSILEALRTAEVVSRESIARGVAGAEKVVLVYEGTRFHAAFRSVDVTERSPKLRGPQKATLRYRDAAIFECAAFEISQMLGIGRVPPTVQRDIDGTSGTLQIWLEATITELELIEQDKEHPPDDERWFQQRQVMYLLDNLIGNSDRNQGNLLIDRRWTLWFIDHTRAFRRASRLLYPNQLSACDRKLWKALQNLDKNSVEERLSPFLETQEIARLLKRKAKLVRHIQQLIDRVGEDNVLFDLRPPRAESVGWDGAPALRKGSSAIN